MLAQVNIGRLVAPIESPLIADFVAALDEVNAVADAAPGFVWRLQTEDGDATAVRGFERDAVGSDGGVIINMSVWESVEALAAYAYGDEHIAVLRRRREWFEKMTHAHLVLWWIPRGHIPTVSEAEDRLDHLREQARPPMRSRSGSTSRHRAGSSARRSAARKTGPARSSRLLGLAA